MPHDIRGQEIKVGDMVTVLCRVTRVEIGEHYCNLSLETSAPMYPGNQRTGLSLNAKQVEVVAPGRGYGDPARAESRHNGNEEER